jgi:hypothetical protein
MEENVFMYIYIYIYVCICMCVYIYIYIYGVCMVMVFLRLANGITYIVMKLVLNIIIVIFNNDFCIIIIDFVNSPLTRYESFVFHQSLVLSSK